MHRPARTDLLHICQPAPHVAVDLLPDRVGQEDPGRRIGREPDSLQRVAGVLGGLGCEARRPVLLGQALDRRPDLKARQVEQVLTCFGVATSDFGSG